MAPLPQGRAGRRSSAGPAEIETATTRATTWLNTRAKLWVWGRPAPPTRPLRRRFIYLP